MNFQIVPAPNDYDHPSDAASHVFAMGDPVITPSGEKTLIIEIRDHYINRAGDRVDLPQYQIISKLSGSPVVWFFGYQLRRWEPIEIITPSVCWVVVASLGKIRDADGWKPSPESVIGVFTEREKLDRYLESLPKDGHWGNDQFSFRTLVFYVNVGEITPPSNQ